MTLTGGNALVHCACGWGAGGQSGKAHAVLPGGADNAERFGVTTFKCRAGQTTSSKLRLDTSRCGAIVLHFSLGFQSECSQQSCFWVSPLRSVSAGLPTLLWWPAWGANPSSDLWGQDVCLQTQLGDQLVGALSPQHHQGLGSWIMGLCPG